MFPDMATKRSDEATEETETKTFAFRAKTELFDKLDAWLGELNRGRRAPLKRADLVRCALEWAAETRPNVEAK